ncbi:MAG: chromosome segregation protein ScpA [Bacteroidetes bacterium]|nr:chromosome segregation protein ScpA [Saprospirales bacterium]RMD97147.1 MAG: chromosome segregation protein ScpA [Bacteroidota bacterium]
MQNSQDTYQIVLPQFEGPFDLLLFFIERDELDINDIPIAKITDDFLAYIRQMEAMNIDLASEFILVAATLCRIKARMLIPRKPVDEEGNEIDPRQELVQRLLEYKRYKSVLDDMRKLEEERSSREYRGNVSRELRKIASVALVDVELESLSLFRLLRTFERMVQRFEESKHRVVHTVAKWPYTIAEKQEYIFKKIKPGKRTEFKELFAGMRNRIEAIVTFLALLELLNLQKVAITQGEGPNNFWVEPKAEEPAEASSAEEEE